MALNNYNDNMSNDFYKVSFVTTHSESIPDKMRQTGALIIMDNVNTQRKSLWFRGRLVASGYGFINSDTCDTATYFIDNIDNIFGPPNGVYQFIDGYTMTNGEKGRSLSERFNDTYSYIEDLKESGSDLQSYVYNFHNEFSNAYSYTLDYIENTYDNLYSYINQTAEDIRDEFNAADQAIWSYTYNSYSYLISSYNNLRTYLLDSYSYVLGYIADTYENSIEFTNEKFYEAHKYVDDFAYKLVGGAPEELDQLKEIADVLTYMRDQGLNVWENIYDIQKSYVTHFVPDENGYAYVNPNTYILNSIEHKGQFNFDSYNGIWPDKDSGIEWPDDYIEGDFIQGTYTYIYYTYEYSVNGQLAISSNLINSGYIFDNIQLENLLPKILPPYNYQKPVVYIPISEIHQLNNTIIEYPNDEYGFENLRIPINIKYNTKDSTRLTITQFDSLKNKFVELMNVDTPAKGTPGYNNHNLIFESTSVRSEYDVDKTTTLQISCSGVDREGFLIFNDAQINYGQSIERYHPIPDYNIVDNRHGYLNGELMDLDIFESLRVPVRYKIKIFLNSFDLYNFDGYSLDEFITSNFYRSSKVFDSTLAANVVYIAIPSKLSNNLLGLKIENFDTLISQEILNPTQDSMIQLEVINPNTIYFGNELNLENYIIYKYSLEENNLSLTQRFRIIAEFDSIHNY
ncbi:MAG: hypothetical protein J1F35_03550 [Erysipelotrichales bacterium]|nr:hypothetical protein [Erysipelotrichales bacterium]